MPAQGAATHEADGVGAESAEEHHSDADVCWRVERSHGLGERGVCVCVYVF